MNKKRIIITGCSKVNGVGYQLAQELLKRGHEVIATIRELSQADIYSELCQSYKTLHIKQLDLCNSSSISEFVAAVLQQFGYVDVLVNNAANVAYGPVETLSQIDLQTTFQTKVFGPIALIQGFLPSMRARKQGLLLTTSSIFCSMPITLPGFSAYISAIYAFEIIQQCLAIELAPWNIQAVNFQPGPIATSLSKFEGSKKIGIEKNYEGFVEAAYAWVKENIPYQTAAEIAPVYADIIESDSPTFTSQSNEFGKQFVSQYRADPSSMKYLENFIEHFRKMAKINKTPWHIDGPFMGKD